MTELRLILLVIGIVIIGLVYFLGSRGKANAPAASSGSRRQAPQLGDLDGASPSRSRQEPGVADAGPEDDAPSSVDVMADDPPEPRDAAPPPSADDAPDAAATVASEAHDQSAPAPPAPSAPDRIVMFHLLPLEDQLFEASALVSALRAEGLRFGHHGIFHRFAGEGNPGPETVPVFSVANILKPGSFDLDTLEDTRLKGVSLVLVLPGPADPVAAFADMLATGRRLAAIVDGRLVDGAGSPVSRQSAAHMREEIINYQHANSYSQDKDMQHDMLS